jgi:hypothetical protein
MAPKTPNGRLKRIDADSLLPTCPKVQSSVLWPAPIDLRLNDLVDDATRVGERLSKADALAALVLAAPTDPEELGQLVRKYRSARARDAVPQAVRSGVISVAPRQSGRRPHH